MPVLRGCHRGPRWHALRVRRLRAVLARDEPRAEDGRMICPFCGSEHVERVSHQWFCACCSKAWIAFTAADHALLAIIGIAA